jgi:hypothetical protein
MTSLLRRSSRTALLLCLLGGSCLSLPAAQARPFELDSSASSYGTYAPYSTARSGGDRHRDWLEAQRARSEQAYQQTQRRLDQLERCLGRSRQSADRDQCLRRDLEARERQWQREQRDWQQLIRRQGRIAQLAWPPGY